MMHYIKSFLRPKGKLNFVRSLPEGVKILDVGCGNFSVLPIKKLKKKCYYVGLDVENYNQSDESIFLMDEYILTTPELFSRKIEESGVGFDAIICSHNIEHVSQREQTLSEILNKVNANGMLYLSFPSKDSLEFPSRKGTLNYFDDRGHVYPPPDFLKIKEMLIEHGFNLEYCNQNYRPWLLRVVGFLFEPLSLLSSRVLVGTWELYGFESVIWAKKNSPPCR